MLGDSSCRVYNKPAAAAVLSYDRVRFVYVQQTQVGRRSIDTRLNSYSGSPCRPMLVNNNTAGYKTQQLTIEPCRLKLQHKHASRVHLRTTTTIDTRPNSYVVSYLADRCEFIQYEHVSRKYLKCTTTTTRPYHTIPYLALPCHTISYLTTLLLPV